MQIRDSGKFRNIKHRPHSSLGSRIKWITTKSIGLTGFEQHSSDKITTAQTTLLKAKQRADPLDKAPNWSCPFAKRSMQHFQLKILPLLTQNRRPIWTHLIPQLTIRSIQKYTNVQVGRRFCVNSGNIFSSKCRAERSKKNGSGCASVHTSSFILDKSPYSLHKKVS